MNSNSNDGPLPTNTPENASFSSDIGKIFSELINTFCCQQGFVYKENSHVGSPPKAEKFKDDFVAPFLKLCLIPSLINQEIEHFWQMLN